MFDLESDPFRILHITYPSTEVKGFLDSVETINIPDGEYREEDQISIGTTS